VKLSFHGRWGFIQHAECLRRGRHATVAAPFMKLKGPLAIFIKLLHSKWGLWYDHFSRNDVLDGDNCFLALQVSPLPPPPSRFASPLSCQLIWDPAPDFTCLWRNATILNSLLHQRLLCTPAMHSTRHPLPFLSETPRLGNVPAISARVVASLAENKGSCLPVPIT
jgi:hypothetical protein